MAFIEYLYKDLAFQIVPFAVLVIVVVLAKRRGDRKKAERGED